MLMLMLMHFSALQRAEIAEITTRLRLQFARLDFSALQRAEIAEIALACNTRADADNFSALQRAEIAEIEPRVCAISRLLEFQCSSTSRNC